MNTPELEVLKKALRIGKNHVHLTNEGAIELIDQIIDLRLKPVKTIFFSPKIDEMVNRFLAWKLPESVSSDPCVTTSGDTNRCGTNLLTANEAKLMFEQLMFDLMMTYKAPQKDNDLIIKYIELLRGELKRCSIVIELEHGNDVSMHVVGANKALEETGDYLAIVSN